MINRKVLAISLALAALVGASADKCDSSSGNSSSGKSKTASKPSMECLPGIDPGCSDSNGGGGGTGGGPVASADAAPLGNPTGCFLHSLDGIGMEGSKVVGNFVITCQAPPVMMLITARLQMKNSAGNWVDETPLYVYHAPAAGQPLPRVGVPQHHPVAPGKLTADCVTGTWRLEGHWSGLKSDGKGFPNPADGDTPADWSSAPAYFKC